MRPHLPHTPTQYKPRVRLAPRFSIAETKEHVTTLALGLASLALALAPILFLFWLIQPKVLVNPGISALRVPKAASFEPFLQEPPQSVEPPRRESPARLTQNGPQVREAATSAQRQLPRPGQRRNTAKRAHGLAQNSSGHRRWAGREYTGSYQSPASSLAAHHRQTRPNAFVVARSWQDDFNARREEIAR
jgi:hypothetical protein